MVNLGIEIIWRKLQDDILLMLRESPVDFRIKSFLYNTFDFNIYDVIIYINDYRIFVLWLKIKT